MTSPKTSCHQSPSTSQIRDSSTRLSLAIRKLDTLIIRLENIGSKKDPSDSLSSQFLFDVKNGDCLERPNLEKPEEA